MAWGRKKSGGGGVAWLALLVSLAALFLAWRAYERSGGRLEEDLAFLDRQVDVGEPEAGDWRQGLSRARERLLASREDLDSREFERVQEEVARVREELSRSVEGAGAGARRAWRDLDRELEDLQDQLRGGGSRAREKLDSVLEKIRRAAE